MNASPAPKIALLYPGDRAARDRADPAASRFAALFEAFAAAGVDAQPAVWHDDFANEVRAQLRTAQLVLAWCNPIEDGRRRDGLDALLREVAQAGWHVPSAAGAELVDGLLAGGAAVRGLLLRPSVTVLGDDVPVAGTVLPTTTEA